MKFNKFVFWASFAGWLFVSAIGGISFGTISQETLGLGNVAAFLITLMFIFVAVFSPYLFFMYLLFTHGGNLKEE